MEYSVNLWKTFILLIVCQFVVRWIYGKLYRRYHSLPPGPDCFVPFTGYLLTIFTYPSTWWKQVAAYGPIVLSTMFGKEVVIVNDSYTGKRLLTQLVDDRDPLFQAKKIFGINFAMDKSTSFEMHNGEKFRKGKQAFHKMQLSLIKNQRISKLVYKQMEESLISVKTGENKIWYPRKLLNEILFNIQHFICFGKEVDFRNDDAARHFLQEFTMKYCSLGKKVVLGEFLMRVAPQWFVKLIPDIFFKDMYQFTRRFSECTMEMINKHENAINDPRVNNHIRIRDLNLSEQVATVKGLLIGGVLPAAYSLEFAIFELAKQQDIQNELRDELLNMLKSKKNIDSDYKDDGSVMEKNIHKLPLLRAFVHEILRIACPPRMSVHHYVSKNVWIKTKDNRNTFQLRKGTHVYMNIHYIHHNLNKNEEHWKNNNNNLSEICLDNWLQQNHDGGKRFVMNPSFVAFSHGKHSCSGKTIATNASVSCLAFLLVHYKFWLDKQHENIDFKWKGLQLAMPSQEIPIIIRKIQRC